MFFRCIWKITDNKILDLLRKIERTEATIMYLRLIRAVLIAYIIEDISVQERIFNGVFVVQFIRIWRQWLHNNKISVDHFLTLNTWEGLELNLILLLRLALDNKAENIFFFNSQQNEAFFRLLRSYTGMESMVVNCSMKGFISRVHRIQLEEIIMKELESQFIFPKLVSRKKHHPMQPKTNLSRTQIESIIDDALAYASNQAREIGMTVEQINLAAFLRSVRVDNVEEENSDEYDPNEDLLATENDRFSEQLLDEMSIDEITVSGTLKHSSSPQLLSLQNMILSDIPTGIKYLDIMISSTNQ